MQANVEFWLPAATDGQAKNFTLFPNPGGRFSLATFYDVMSAQPLFDAGQLQRNRMKLAMAIGEKRRMTVQDIVLRHFVQSAQSCGMGESVLREIFTELQDAGEAALAQAQAETPDDFPAPPRRLHH